jgi:protein-S-isoprenylcysteine O-methyltransferase Ste14
MTDPDTGSGLPPAQDKADILFFPPYLAIAAPVLSIVLEVIASLGLLPGWSNPLTLLPGLVLLCLAGWLEVTATRSFSAAQTNVSPRRPALAVVRKGPYRFTRNPMYLGMVLLNLGLTLMFSLDWGVPIAVLLWAALHWGVVLREEAYLTEKFGEDYKVLLKSTRRWL